MRDSAPSQLLGFLRQHFEKQRQVSEQQELAGLQWEDLGHVFVLI